ncbi:MAG: hydrolase 1, exosortase A system-associated [Pseudomonadota bacterium]
MTVRQLAVRFDCEACALIGIIHMPERPRARGVLMLTGGPQYRVGSHRQFVLLARELAAAGTPVMRFDHRGMGDSAGAPRRFQELDADIHTAVGEFIRQAPALREVVIWGLCDAASAGALYAHRDRRVCGLILLNPWVRTEQGAARATLRHYYLARMRDGQFWRKLMTGKVALGATISSLGQQARQAARGSSDSLAQRVFDSLGAFVGPILIILSGADLTAREFSSHLVKSELDCTRVDIAHATHTFSRREWRDQVARACIDWIVSW